jgi:hypothetical protein
LGEQYRSLSSSLCSFLHSAIALSLLGPNILVSTLFSILRHPQPALLPQCERPSFTPIQNRQNYSSVYLDTYQNSTWICMTCHNRTLWSLFFHFSLTLAFAFWIVFPFLL